MADKEADDVKAEMTTEVVEKVANETEVEQENLEKTLSETNLDSQQAVKEKTKSNINYYHANSYLSIRNNY